MKHDDTTLNMCTKHASPFMYHGSECPWCAFARDAVERMAREYRRGFEDGVRAADTDHARKEAENAKRRSDSKESPKADRAVPADVPAK